MSSDSESRYGPVYFLPDLAIVTPGDRQWVNLSNQEKMTDEQVESDKEKVTEDKETKRCPPDVKKRDPETGAYDEAGKLLFEYVW